VPAFPYDVVHDENDEDFQQFLIFTNGKLLKEHGGSGGHLYNSEQKRKKPRPVTVTMEYLKELYWENGGSYCCVFGVPNSDNLLSIDKMDVTTGYEPGNLLIMLKCAN
jgi:hypothetical protein